MLIRNPINPYPQNIAIDPHKTFFSFTFTGNRLGSYKINIYSYPEGNLVGETEVINIKDYAYNNTEIYTSETIANYFRAFFFGSFTWEIIMSPFQNLETETKTSIRYFFQCASTPQISPSPDDPFVTGFVINEQLETYFFDTNIPHIPVNNLQTRNIDILGYYVNDNIKYYYFKLFDENNNLIDETNKIFSSKINYSFSGLLSPRNYTLELDVVSQTEQYLNIVFDISTSYVPRQDLNYPPILTCNQNEANIKIEWIKDLTAAGKATGDYKITDGKVEIESGEIIYDNISFFPINMDKNNFAVGIKTTINDNTTKIFDYINNNVLYEVYMENYKIYLRYGEKESTNKTIQEIVNFKSDIVFGIQNSSTPVEDTGYMWYVGEDYNMPYDETKYLLISNTEEYKYKILLQNNKGAISCDIEKILASTEVING